MKKYKYFIANAAMLLILTAILEMTFHEIGHFVTAYFFHAKDLSLHHNFVNYKQDNLLPNQLIIIAAAGPIVSLLLGILFHVVVLNSKKRNKLFVFNLFLSIHGYIGFFGYLMIAPLSINGDTGYIFNALKFPMWLVVGIAILGLIILIKLIKHLNLFLLELAPATILNNLEERKNYVAAIIKYPVYFSVVALMLLNLPVPIWLSLLPPLSLFVLFSGYGDLLKKTIIQQDERITFLKFNTLQPILMIIFILVILMNRLLTFGLFIN